jgi:hypothetical protein
MKMLNFNASNVIILAKLVAVLTYKTHV